jgi:hypothetical protein
MTYAKLQLRSDLASPVARRLCGSRLQGKAYMLTGGSDPVFQDEVPLAKARKGPYQSLLKKVQKQLK